MAEKEVEIVEAGGDPEKACLVCLMDPQSKTDVQDAIQDVCGNGDYELTIDALQFQDRKDAIDHLLSHNNMIHVMGERLEELAKKMADDIAYGRK